MKSKLQLAIEAKKAKEEAARKAAEEAAAKGKTGKAASGESSWAKRKAANAGKEYISCLFLPKEAIAKIKALAKASGQSIETVLGDILTEETSYKTFATFEPETK